MSEMVMMPKSDAQAIWDKVREKTGVSGLLKSGEIAPLIDTITGGGGSGVKEIIPETTLPFADLGGGLYGLELADVSMYPIVAGEEYTVVWDGTEYKCTAEPFIISMSEQTQEMGVYLGNGYLGNPMFGTSYPDTGEPFAFLKLYAGAGALCTLSTEPTHTIRAYQGSGGGNSDDVRYVTFMSEDGSTELLVKPVAVGDDCADVITRGLISKPTKESTAQYSYSFTGWALSAGGTADANALKSVTEDRVVYASFKEVLRYYTIRFYDGDSLLKSESLAYGSELAYTPEKVGYSFEGWVPELTIVTGNADYYAQWLQGATFAGSSWSDIADVVANGKAKETFSVGDTRTIDYNGQSLTLEIVGIEHDDIADGSGKAGLSIMATQTLGVSSSVHWGRKPNTYSAEFYNTGELNEYLNDTVFNLLPTDLKEIIKPVIKDYDDATSAGTSTASSPFTIWAPSINELGLQGKTTMANDRVTVLGNTYQRFTDGLNIAVLPIGGGDAMSFWSRNIARLGQEYGMRIKSTGTEVTVTYLSNTGATGDVCFGFCI